MLDPNKPIVAVGSRGINLDVRVGFTDRRTQPLSDGYTWVVLVDGGDEYEFTCYVNPDTHDGYRVDGFAQFEFMNTKDCDE